MGWGELLTQSSHGQLTELCLVGGKRAANEDQGFLMCSVSAFGRRLWLCRDCFLLLSYFPLGFSEQKLPAV